MDVQGAGRQSEPVEASPRSIDGRVCSTRAKDGKTHAVYSQRGSYIGHYPARLQHHIVDALEREVRGFERLVDQVGVSGSPPRLNGWFKDFQGKERIMSTSIEEWVGPSVAARIACMSSQHLVRLTDAGKIPHNGFVKLTIGRLYDPDVIQRWAEERAAA